MDVLHPLSLELKIVPLLLISSCVYLAIDVYANANDHSAELLEVGIGNGALVVLFHLEI